jgi:gluconolactonase
MFFAPPPVLETTVFARLPDELQSARGDNEWVGGQPHGGPAKSLLEGPSFGPDGLLYCVDVLNGRILRVSGSGQFEVLAEYDGWPNGLKFHQDGRIFVADYKNGIMEFDIRTGRVTPFVVRFNLERFKGVNDLFFAANGDMYFTDQGLTGWQDPSGRLFRVRPDGQINCLLDNLPSPNGLVMDRNETALYVAVTRANAVWKVPLLRNGTVGKVGTYVQLSGGGGPDGLALDAQGRLVIAHVGLGAVWVMSPVGEPAWRIRSTVGLHTTNVAYGGPDLQTLYITESESGTILTARLDVPGKPMYGGAQAR